MRIPSVFLLAAVIAVATASAESERPLMKDFMGLNGHTVQFKPKLYAPVAKLVRDYHPIPWDVGKDTSAPTQFPMAANRVDWSSVYGSWLKEGLRVNACLIFDDIEAANWKSLDKDPAVYGEAFARAFGPGSGTRLVESVEIGNEPGKYSDAEYRKLFEAMAGGVRKGDLKLKIATCAANLGTSGRYSKSVDSIAGLESLYDIVNIHLYAEAEPWPTWRRSYPEDPALKFREDLRSVLTWRKEHAATKELWITEFGWDASTKPAPATGTFAKWIGNSETQQAMWIVRCWMLLAREGVDRAYLYFFNDDDDPHVHGSSGLTRKFEPKPSYHAAAWLQSSLGDYRFTRVIREDLNESYIYEFTHGTDLKKHVLAVWKPAAPAANTVVPLDGGKLVKAERMPLKPGEAEAVSLPASAAGELTLEAAEVPVLIWIER